MAPPAQPQSLPAKLYLLACDLDNRRLAGRGEAGHLLLAAALTELTLRGYLTDAGGKAKRADAGRPGDPVLDDVLQRVTEGRPRTWQTWVGRGNRAMVRAVEQQLASAGVITVRSKRVLGLFPSYQVTVYQVTVLGPTLVHDLRASAMDVLRGGRDVERLDQADVAIVALAAAGELRSVVSRKDARAHRARLGALTARSGPAVPALKDVLAAASAVG